MKKGYDKQLKKNIKKTFFTKTGTINSNLLKYKNYIKNKKLYKLLIEIKNNTLFLDENINNNKDHKITISERIYCILNDITSKPICPVCKENNQIKYLNFKSNKEGYKITCSQTCSNKYNVTKEKRKQTLLKNYGVTSPLKNKKILEKSKKTTFERYGATNVNKLKKFRDKISNTNLKRYGYKSPSENKKVIDKYKETHLLNIYKNKLNNYIKTLQNNNIYISNISKDEFLKKGLKGPYILQCNKCKRILEDIFIYNKKRLPRCYYCHPLKKSVAEIEIKNFIQSFYNGQIIDNDKKILNGLELDIYIPDKGLAIEYNGLMWHSIGKNKSSKFNNYELESELKNKHKFKTEECIKNNIQLFHIFENEWIDVNKQNIWKSMIKNKLGYSYKIYARNTYINLVPNELSKDFLNNYHLQGNITSKIKIGLFSKKDVFNKNGNKIIEKDELISLMSFGKSRYDKNIDFELLRFVSKSGISIIGGASKLFNYFVNNYLEIGQSIKTYADLRYSNGNVYKKLGFELIGQSNPNYFYFNEKFRGNCLESRLQYQKHKIKKLYEEGKIDFFDENLSETKNMYNNGFRKLYDSGNLVFIYKKVNK